MDSHTKIGIKGSPVRKREFKIEGESLAAARHFRQSAGHFLPSKLVDMSPHNNTKYEFNGYGPRPELFPVTIWTNADYTNGMIKAADGIALAHNPHRVHYFIKTGASPEKVENIVGKSPEKFRL